MATYEDAMSALRKADAEGNIEDAKKLAIIAQKLKNETQEIDRNLSQYQSNGLTVEESENTPTLVSGNQSSIMAHETDVPDWGRKHSNLYALYGAMFGGNPPKHNPAKKAMSNIIRTPLEMGAMMLGGTAGDVAGAPSGPGAIATTLSGKPDLTADIESYRVGTLAPDKVALLKEKEKSGEIKLPPIDVFERKKNYILGNTQDEGVNPLGILEVPLTMGSAAASQIASGIAGTAKAITSGPQDAEKTIEEIQSFFTYQPRTDEGKMLLEGMGKVLKPIMDAVINDPAKFWGDQTRELIGGEDGNLTGDIAGTAVNSGIQILPDILGLKGSKTVRKAGLERILKDADVSKIFDEAGNIRKEVIDAAAEVGEDATKIIDELDLKKQVKQIKKMPSERIAESARPNPEILKAADEFGVSDNLLASHSAENPTYRAIEQGLKSVPGSRLAETEKALILDVSKKADDLIQEFGGTLDKSSLSDTYKLKAESIIDDLEKQADVAYKKVGERIPNIAEVSTENSYGKILETIKDLGGNEYLSIPEKKLFAQLDPRTKPTYARLDKIRREIGQAINKGSGPFKDSETGLLKQLYKALSEDQYNAAKRIGGDDFANLYNSAKDLVATRKVIEEQLLQTLGKNLTANITSKARQAMLNLSKGDTKYFDDLINNIPDQLGADVRKSVIASSLNDAFVQGSRAEKSLNIAGFDDFMNGLKRNKSAYSRLKNELGDPAMKRLESFHTLVGGIRRAQKDSITTGRIMSVLKLFDETEGLAAKLYGVGKTVLPEVVTTSSGMPGLATAMRFTMPKGKKMARSMAADELLSSDKFRKAVRGITYETIDESKINAAIKAIPAYKRWAKTLTESEAADLATVGFVGYIMNQNNKEQ